MCGAAIRVDNRTFPLVLATGGDAETLFADCPSVQRVVPDLVLQGIRVAVEAAGAPE